MNSSTNLSGDPLEGEPVKFRLSGRQEGDGGEADLGAVPLQIRTSPQHGVIDGPQVPGEPSASAQLCKWIKNSETYFSSKKLPPYTLSGFYLTTHCSNLHSGRRRRYH
jgi:hypothetical protein